MRNNLRNFSGTAGMSVGSIFGPGVYFSELQVSASGHAQASGLYDSCPMFVLEAAGGPGTWKKGEGVSTSLFDKPHHQAQLKTSGRTPHANIVIRGVFMDSSRAGSPSASDANRNYFERAQAAYDDIVGARLWDNSDVHLLAVVGPSGGLQASEVKMPFDA